MATLVSIPFSPWSMRARMALDLQGIRYELRTFTSMLSEPRLRWETGDWRGRISAPILLREDGPPIRDSFEIAAWGAERTDQPLVTPTNRADVLRWNNVANSILEAGRIRTTQRTMQDPEALRELVPPPISAIRPVAVAVGRYGARRLLRKYAVGLDDEGLRARMVTGLDAIRAALGGRETLLPALSYADVTVAAALAFVEPHPRAKLGPKARVHWVDPELSSAYRDLLGWRDRLFAGWTRAGS